MHNVKLSLVKYCRAEHAADAVEKGRIFVGTFSRYKRIENETIRDIEEGAATPAVLDEETDILISESDNDSLLANSPIKLANEWKLQLPKGVPLWLEQPAFNTFIYCVSNDHEPSIEKAKRLGYDSFFRITDPLNFKLALMYSFSKHYRSEFGVRGVMGLVNYVPQKIHVVNRQTPSHPSKSFLTADFFTKHHRFSEDKEFRYTILEYSNSDRTQFNSFKTEGDVIENQEIAKWLAKA
jgi:hypothetical protein